MAKVSIKTIENLENQSKAKGVINSNFTALSGIIETLLSRDGATRNDMDSNLNMDGYRVLNLPTPTTYSEPALHGELQIYVDQSKQAAEDAESSLADVLVVEAAINETRKYFLDPSATEPEADAFGNALEEGAFYFDTDKGIFEVYVKEEVLVGSDTVVVGSFEVYQTYFKPLPNTTLRGLTDVATFGINNGEFLAWNESQKAFVPASIPSYDISFFLEGHLGRDETPLIYITNRSYTLPANLTDSLAISRVAPASDFSLTIKKNGGVIGTIDWASTETAATFDFPNAVDFASGDILSFFVDQEGDTAMKDTSVTLRGLVT